MQQSPTILGDKKLDIDGFKFGEKSLQMNPARLAVLILAIDPTPKQKEVMKKLGIVLVDDFGKQFFPREETEEKEGEVNNADEKDND